jgi:hypothetical protein
MSVASNATNLALISIADLLNKSCSLLLKAALRPGVSYNAATTGSACMEKREASLNDYWDKRLQDLLQLLQTTPAGLTGSEAKQRLRL